MPKLKEDKFYNFKDRYEHPILLSGEQLIETIKDLNKLYSESGTEYEYTTGSVRKMLSKTPSECSIEEVSIQYVDEYDSREKAYNVIKRIYTKTKEKIKEFGKV